MAFPVAAALCVGGARALEPGQLLVLANGRSPDSVEVARAYMRLRHIPEANLVRLSVPVFPPGRAWALSPADFTRRIWDPAWKVMRERGIEDRILAWAYSVHFPIRITTVPALSIQGLTFLRNRLPDQAAVRRGTYSSPLFAGPTEADGRSWPAEGFEASRARLGKDMPLPSMMLGYTGLRGNTKEAVLGCLERAAAADGTAPAGVVYFVTRDNVRSTCRDWQYPAAQRELTALGIEAVITNRMPVGRTNLLGLMTGAAVVDPGRGNRFLPGSMAEHLTSAAANFRARYQTKLSVWIDAGAAASAGTVSEPFALWPKFPNARFFVHYASGRTMVESFFASIRCPLQILLVGDPLTRPWPRAGAGAP